VVLPALGPSLSHLKSRVRVLSGCAILDYFLPFNIKKRAEDFVNLCLKGGRGIKKAKGHNKCFKKAIASVKCRYLFVAFLNLYVVKGVNNVKLSVELGFAKLRQCFL
jgi:hypothetical protein